ncbi:MAG: DNA topoisomerase VI subunit B [Phycisphaeraceae bacterium]|nr:DNA topoisomerase VI subunit B [Phycisphaeraceae bacterium]
MTSLLESGQATMTDEQRGQRSRRGAVRAGATAEQMASKQREISVSEFFAKNRHLLGFDNPRKALLTTVKEAVDNSLDACEEAGILPDILVEIRGASSGVVSANDDRFVVIVQDNGPGIVRRQVENIFGKLLYGSKFHRLKMSRGQQGIGISAAGMYGLITTGRPVRIITRTGAKRPAHEVVLKMDTSKNRADVVSDTEHPEDNAIFPDGHGTRVEIELLGKYFKGARSVDEYIQLTSIANPHASFTYRTPATSSAPEGESLSFPRSVEELPPQPQEIRPHPHGIELGTLIGMLERTEQTKLGGFFAEEFCRIGPKVAQQICAAAGVTAQSWVKSVDHAAAEKLYAALQVAKVMGPPTDCVSPIGVRTLIRGLEQGLRPDFIAVASRPPAVYRGRPFIIEAGIAYGGNLRADESARVYRFANRVPLQYQQSACSSFKAVIESNWRLYGLEQPRGSLPVGPMVFMIHMASVWVPFTSESKEAIADYDEIRAEMALALRDCGRRLRAYLNRRKRMRLAGERRDVFRRYIGEVAKACASLTGQDAEPIYEALLSTARRKTVEMDQVLDDEGRVVRDLERLEADESVYIRAGAEDGDDADAAADAVEPGGIAGGTTPAVRRGRRSAAIGDGEAAQGTLFDESDDGPPAVAPGSVRRKVIVKKKKVRRRSGG